MTSKYEAAQSDKYRDPFPTEAECLLWVWRHVSSGDGSRAVCVTCGQMRKFHRVSGRRAVACDHCGTHVYPARGTVLEASKVRLSVWFRAADTILSSGGAITARRLADELCVTPRTAARLKRSITGAMAAGGPDARLLTKMRTFISGVRTGRERRGTSATMERITAAACRVFGERGVTHTRVADIAAEAGVSTAIVHYYFRRKDQVLLAALRWASEREAERERSVLARRDHVGRVRSVVDLAVPSEATDRAEYRLWLEMYLLGAEDPALMKECGELSERWRGFIEQVVDEGAAAGAFHPVAPPATIARRLVNLFDGIGFRLVVDPAPAAVARARYLIADFLADQLGLATDRVLPASDRSVPARDENGRSCDREGCAGGQAGRDCDRHGPSVVRDDAAAGCARIAGEPGGHPERPSLPGEDRALPSESRSDGPC